MSKPFQLIDDQNTVVLFVPGMAAVSMGGLGSVHSIIANDPKDEPFAPLINAAKPVPASELARFVAAWSKAAA